MAYRFLAFHSTLPGPAGLNAGGSFALPLLRFLFLGRHPSGYLLGSVLRYRLRSHVGFHGSRSRLAYWMP